MIFNAWKRIYRLVWPNYPIFSMDFTKNKVSYFGIKSKATDLITIEGSAYIDEKGLHINEGDVVYMKVPEYK